MASQVCSVCEDSSAHSPLICVLFYIYVTFNKKFLEMDLRIKKIQAQMPSAHRIYEGECGKVWGGFSVRGPHVRALPQGCPLLIPSPTQQKDPSPSHTAERWAEPGLDASL